MRAEPAARWDEDSYLEAILAENKRRRPEIAGARRAELCAVGPGAGGNARPKPAAHVEPGPGGWCQIGGLGSGVYLHESEPMIRIKRFGSKSWGWRHRDSNGDWSERFGTRVDALAAGRVAIRGRR